ncbi:hypothetical protein, unknown function [Leishmania tarentolae]|uniref:Leucine-rich repeat-containing N-terminal plant-type domain-containing protein n=1 Tax=Leishmania tarentolae TaxID=5689 RepID=A0A640KWR1_LEITA|nr:hypothetical protein, unknown function [Leishmania tarentolae]
MAPPHRCVALMAAVVGAALLLTVDANVARVRLRSTWDAMEDHVFLRSFILSEAKPFAISEAGRVNTLKVLQAFAAALPSLGWSGGDLCSWSGVRCLGDNVSVLLAHSGVSGTLPEMPDDVDYSMVKLDQITIFTQDSGITGTLPSSWGKLRKVRTINLAYTGMSGALPASWSSMEAIEQIIISSSQITGTLPESWSTMPKLRRIYLQGCNLHGSLPESWARMPSLERLSLQNNNFCGCVPDSWVTSPTLLMGVDARHRMGNCSTAQPCGETSEPDPVISSSSTSTTAERDRHSTTTSTTMPTTSTRTTEPSPRPESQCNVPNCTLCASDESVRCSACADGYVLTDEGQCMQHPETLEAERFTTREAEQLNTLKVLQAFAAAMPSLGWSGDDFCRWRGVRCLGDNVSVLLAHSGVSGTLPEMPDDVDYSMVRLDQIVLFGQHRSVTGTLPSSWGKLRKMRALGLQIRGSAARCLCRGAR